MLQLTKRLQEGISLINTTDVNKVGGILSRVCAALCSGNSQVFSEEEEEKLSTSLGLPIDKTKKLIFTTVHIIQQAAHGIVRPPYLGEQLRAIGMIEDRTEKFVELWTTNAKPIVDAFRQKDLSENQLTDISWDLHLQTASSGCARQAHPIAHLQLGLSDNKAAPNKSVVLQFNEEQLQELYNQMEQIQANLDALR